MYSFETIELDIYKGDTYFLTGFVNPDPANSDSYDPDIDANSYGVSVARAASYPQTSNIQIVRMDTCHGKPHLDKEYLPPNSNESKKVYLSKDYSYSRMKTYLLDNWKQFVDLYINYNE